MEQPKWSAEILGIGTAVPPHRLEQEETAERLAEALADEPNAARWVKRIFRQCGVRTRYTCEPDLLQPGRQNRYVSYSRPERFPSTAERMETYRRESVPLALEAARTALRESGMNASEVTHLITVSCTGFFLPGLDAVLVPLLGLQPDVYRSPLTFLGCGAGLTAIRVARDLTAANPSARVLIICVELCTLHIQPSSDREALFGASFFGDGASACVIAPTGLVHHRGSFLLGQGRAKLLADTSDDMVWKVGNHGFHLYLSPEIPKRIGRLVPPEIEGIQSAPPLLWAIHPGGRGILDELQEACRIADAQIEASRSVLSRYGNLSSATLLFVLREIRERISNGLQERGEGWALAFSPGLTAEWVHIGFQSDVC
ncbi:type III polyketide synthase [Cohnella pontilimi]|uniref:Type III polyketide synthase n=1 Tax=Cohnella pontilimi TaxID=2564100 RepID=A0A4V5LSQ3_9BACL|nr:type III polyketide synthase [Cohnella pontilimi]TJY43909.1 type III polyketide synthase [Cohnella pontilimi]